MLRPLKLGLDRIFLFWFDLVPSELLGRPDQEARTSRHRLKVVFAANRLVAWNLYDADAKEDLCKLAFWIGKTEQILGDEEASRMLSRPMRAPLTL